MSVNESSNSWKLGKHLNSVIEVVFPVNSFIELSFSIELVELRVFLKVEQRNGEHSHRVQIFRKTIDKFEYIFAQLSLFNPSFFEVFGIFIGGKLSSHEKVKQSFREGFSVLNSFGKFLTEIWNCVTSKGDTRHGVQD